MGKRRFLIPLILIAAALALMSVLAVLYFTICPCGDVPDRPYVNVRTLAGTKGEFSEPFGVAVRNGETFLSDGETGKIWRIGTDGVPVEFAAGFDTPSAIAFDRDGNLFVADTGSHTIKRIGASGNVTVAAGAEGQMGDADGDVLSARFNGPVGIAVRDDGGIVVADTYNDKIKLIVNGRVTTLAGSIRGFADGNGAGAKFDTPCSVAVWHDGRVLVADTMNSRIRVIEPDGVTGTLAGNGEKDIRNGSLLAASFYKPSAIAVRDNGVFIADGNAVRVIRSRPFPLVETITKTRRGFVDGPPFASRFNRISGLAFDAAGDIIVADSDNSAVRAISSQPAEEPPKLTDRRKRTDPSEFRMRQPARWPYEPADAKRDIAGTLGEIRGELVDAESRVRFHNGLDIAGGYGEKAYFIREEKVLDPHSAENFGTSRELLRLPALGYIHLRLGRDAADKPFGDKRFQFDGDMKGIRVRRGSRFKAGELIGTLNLMNHVHLIAGPGGDEMNALDALSLPGVSDKIAPIIQDASIFDENWTRIETEQLNGRIRLTSKARVVVNAFDRIDGNPERRRLGVFRLGYQLLKADLSPLSDINWNINFDRNPDPDAAQFTYARGSRSGATGETTFNYIVTNKVSGDLFSEGFLETAGVSSGEYILRAFAADYFNNISSKDISVEVTQ